MSHISILLLEDNLQLGNAVVSALNELGYPDIQHVLTIKDATNTIERDKIDLCIMDVQHGPQTCEAVASEAVRRGIRVILTSGGDTLENSDLAESCVFIQKPASKEELSTAIQEAMRRPFV